MQGSTMKQRPIVWLAVVAGVALVLAVAWAAILWTRPEPIRHRVRQFALWPVGPGRDGKPCRDAACNRRGERQGWRQRTADRARSVRRRKQSSRGARECAGDRRQPMRG